MLKMTSRLQPKHKVGFPKGRSGNPAGKKPGTKNRVSRVAARRAIEAAMREAAGKAADKAAKALTPLGFMEDVLRTPSQFPFAARAWAAEKAAPYVHRRMPIAIEGGERPLTVLSATELAKLGSDELERLVELLGKLGVGLPGEAGG